MAIIGRLKAVAVGSLAGLGVAAGVMCKTTPPPAPPPPVSSAEAVYNALVDAGCLGQDDAGIQAVAEEYAEYGDAEAWLSCMWNGGGVFYCQAPCGSAALHHK